MLGQLMQTLRPAAAGAARSYSSAAKEMNVREALNSALDEEMAADPSVFLMGEEVPSGSDVVYFPFLASSL